MTRAVVSFDVAAPLRPVWFHAKLRGRVRAFGTFAALDHELRHLAPTVDEHVAPGHAFARLSGTLPHGTAVTDPDQQDQGAQRGQARLKSTRRSGTDASASVARTR